MKKSNSLSLIIISWILMIACVVFLILQKRSLEKTISKNSITHDIKKRHWVSKNIVLESNVILATRSTGKLIGNKILLTDTRRKKYSSAEIFAEGTPSLVFRYSQQGCSPCISATFSHLKRLGDNVKPDKLRIIVIVQD